ncbi:MAG: hypothetical protein QNJ53_11325 [Pleurocapsa sp. MO_192.B19]|nr:hypothetical protein [Pleurocapsa sp. MO_192.B19]
MEFDIVFVHGTGVREPTYSKTFSIVQQELGERGEDLRFHKCYWGGPRGSTLNAGGLSLPKFDEKKSLDSDLSDEEYYLGLWELLYEDPLIELQILAISSNTSKVSLGATPGHDLDLKFRGYKPSEDLGAMLKQAGIEEFCAQAQTIIVGEKDYRGAIASAQEPLDEYRMALARALVAQSSLLFRDKYGEYALSLNGELRDRIVEQIVLELGSKDTKKGLISGVKQNISGIIRRRINNTLQSKRSGFSEKYSGTLGDILMYQARGQELRDFVRQTIEPLEGKIIVVAHSLGGIICVDLLLEKEPPQIDLLVTVGSQAPVLFELNALVGMEYDPNAKLPEEFPKWLNIYDRNDFLSYIGEKIFPGRITDFEVDSQQSFPQSHGAYWAIKEVWDEIWQKIEEVAND